MSRWPAALIALCLLGLVAAPAGVGAAAADAPVGIALLQEFDRAQFRIAVYPNGSARWTFHYERTLANDSERRQFEGFAADFNANETRLYTDFRNQSRTLVERGAAATGRDMAARGFARQAFVTTQLNDVGVVEMAFTWTGFARTEDDRVVVGDVFEGGLYVGPDQALVVRAAGGLQFQSVDPRGTTSAETLAASDTVTWQGERTFADNHPRIVLAPPKGTPIEPGVSPTTTTVTDTGAVSPTTASRTTTAATESGGFPWLIALALAVLAAAGVVFYRRGGLPTGSDGAGGPPAGTGVDEAALLDDEARIEGLLREHDGQMRQSAIVEATGWSKSKVSMVLSEMEEADEVRKLRVGRENIVSLPGHEPDAAGPPDDGE